MRATVYGYEERFGLAVELISGAMKGLALYCALLFFGFTQYQSGTAAFWPWYYALIVLWTVMLAWLFRKLNGAAFVLSHLVMLAIWMVVAFASHGIFVYMLAAGIIGAGSSIFLKFWREDTDARKHIRRFKVQSHGHWGFIIGLCNVMIYLDTAPASEEFPIPASRCAGYMVAAFGIYLVLAVMMRYLYMQYDYFRNKDGMDGDTSKRLGRMNAIVFVVSAVAIAVAVLATGMTIVKALAWVVEKGLMMLIGAGILGISELKVKQFTGGNIVTPGEGKGELQKAVHAHSAADTSLRETILMIVFIVLVICVLWKLYKNIVANFTIGNDDAEYITKKDETEYIEEMVKTERDGVNFGSSNREKIRRHFYRVLNRRMKKKDVGTVRRKTPQELARMYAVPADREDLQKLASYYEKARYSQEECTDEEVREVKEMVEQL